MSTEVYFSAAGGDMIPVMSSKQRKDSRLRSDVGERGLEELTRLLAAERAAGRTKARSPHRWVAEWVVEAARMRAGGGLGAHGAAPDDPEFLEALAYIRDQLRQIENGPALRYAVMRTAEAMENDDGSPTVKPEPMK